MTQSKKKELGDIARSIEALFSRPEHQTPVVEEPWSSGAPEAELMVAGTETETEVEAPETETEVEAPETETEVEAPKTETEVEAPAAEAGVEVAEAEVEGSEDALEVPLSEVEQTLSDATSHYLQAPFGDREEAQRALRSAVEMARSARALSAIASNVEILLLQASGDPEAEDLARELMDGTVSLRMVVALGRIRDEETRDALVRAYARLGAPFARAIADVLAESEDRSARKIYVAALGAFGAIGAQAVEGMLKDSRWFVVRNAVAVLGGVGDPSGVEALIETLANEHPGVRRETVMSLAKIGGEDSGSLVSSMLGDSDPEVRSAAARAVAALKVEKSYKPLMEILKKGDDEDVIEEVLRALGALGDPSAVPAIEKQMAGSMFSRPGKGVRIAGLAALAVMGTPRAVALVEKAKSDKDPEIRSAAAQFLAGS